MAMKQTGYVAKIEDGMAKIRVERESACGGNCAGCHGCPQNAVFVSCPDDPKKPFLIGEQVLVTMPTNQFFMGILQSYGVFIVSMILGAVLGFIFIGNEGASVLGGFFGLLFGGWLVHLIGKHTPNHITVLRMENDNERGIKE